MAFRQVKFTANRLFRALGRASGTPHQIALGVAIGFFVGWLPIVGIQMVVAVAICQIAGANKVVPIFPVWLTNPATIVPIYSFNYWVGWLVTGGPPISELASALARMITPPRPEPGAGFFSTWWAEFRHSLGELLSMGWEMQIPLWLGCSLVGLALAISSYYLSLRSVESFRRALERRRRATKEKFQSARLAAKPEE